MLKMLCPALPCPALPCPALPCTNAWHVSRDLVCCVLWWFASYHVIISADGGKADQLKGMLSGGLITQAEYEQNLASLQR